MSSTLDGITILDLSTGPAAALATMLLSDQGARVIRVIEPDAALYRAGGFVIWDRGKACLRLPLAQAGAATQAASRFRELLAGADVLVEDFSPGIIRVLSHEINNSLAPIKSISGSLQRMLGPAALPDDLGDDVERGLEVISSRAEALGRFMASYAELARLPQPELEDVEVRSLVQRVADLETRLEVQVMGGEDMTILSP